MPRYSRRIRRRRPYRRRRRPTFAKNYRYRQSKFSLYRGTGLPSKLITTLHLVHRQQVSVMGGASNAYNTVYTGNDCFLPLLAESTRQPYAFDQLLTLYNRWYVSASRIIVRAHLKAGAGGAAQTLMLEVHPSHSAGFNPDIQTAIERPRSKFRMLVTNDKPAYISMKASTKSMLGKYINDQTGSFQGGPKDLWFWHIAIDPPAGGGESWTVDYSVEFYFRTVFWERKSIAKSDEPAPPS